MLRGLKAVFGALLAALAFTSAAFGGGAGMKIGAVEDAAKWGDPAAKMSLAKLAGFDTVRMTLQWSSGQTAPSAGELLNTQNAAAAARAAGIDPIIAIYNVGSSSTPNTPELRAQFVQFATAVVRGLPAVQRFVVGNEPNLNRYWMPQFNSDGSDAAAPAYLSLLAETYDAVKAARPDAIIIGGALAPRGEDSATSTRPTHSPVTFIQDVGAAYRASGRATPLMDIFDMHVYEDHSSLSPSFEHPNSKTISVPDYAKLVSSLGAAFDGTAQRGSSLPILYGEYGVESIIPAAKASVYTGTEPTSTRPVDEAWQGASYEEAFKLVTCQPNVIGILVFHVSDESALAAWQSGPYYADDTAKSSLPRIRDAAAAARAGTLTTCPDATAPAVTLTGPADGTIVGSSVTFSATASDDVGFGKIDFLVNGTFVGSKAYRPYTFTWNAGTTNGPVTITARASDAAHNVGTSAPVTITVDTTPPDTVITSGPSGFSGQDVSFWFGSTESDTTYACSLDGAAYASCASPTSYSKLAPGSHTFSVRATDALGNTDATPAFTSWTVVDSTPPETTITDGPSGTTPATSASFSFSADEPASFECSLDAAAYTSCSTPQSYSGLTTGSHTFLVRALDPAGNVDPTPASRTWTISLAPTNDPFAAAQAIVGSSGKVSGTTLYATKEPGEPAHAGYSGGHSVWYRWTAPATGTYWFETTGSSFNTLLGIYRGSSVSALSRVAANNDAADGVYTSRVKFTAYAQTTYSIAVDGYGGASGSLVLAWRP